MMWHLSRISDFDAGFICGLVAGEGSFTGDYKQPVLCIKLHQEDPQPLRFIQEKAGWPDIWAILP